MHTSRNAFHTSDVEAKLRHLLQAEGNETLTRLSAFVATVVRAPVVFMTVVETERQHFCHGFCESGPLQHVTETPITRSFCRHVVASGEPLIVPDTTRDKVTKGNPVITEGLVMAYAGVPLIHSSGVKVGTLCAIDYKPRVWTSEDMTVLRAVAAQVMTELDLRLTTSELDKTLHEMRTAEEVQRATARETIHDLRTPLNSVLLCLETLPLAGPLNADQQEYLNICLRASHALRQLVDTLYDAEVIAREGASALQYEACSPVALIRQAVDQVAGLAASKGIQLGNTVAEGLPVVEVDRAKFTRVLANLLGNAVKFTQRGGKVSVEAWLATESPTPMMVFSVSDTGIGMDREQLAAALRDGSRAAPTRETAGIHGQGLVFSRKVVQAHGGELSVDSVRGQGSTAFVQVPLYRATDPGRPADRGAVDVVRGPDQSGGARGQN